MANGRCSQCGDSNSTVQQCIGCGYYICYECSVDTEEVDQFLCQHCEDFEDYE
jgi:hypothetical protein